MIVENSTKGNFVKKSLYDFTASIASKIPVPGGGSAAAYSGALAASLVMMVSHLTIGKKNYETSWESAERILRQVEPLKEKLLLLVDKDAEAYSLVVSSLKLPKETESQKDIAIRNWKTP